MKLLDADPQSRFREELAHVGKHTPPLRPDPRVIGRTTFDGPGSEDMALTVLLAKDRVREAPSQSLLRIVSADGKKYLGVVDSGPFAEPDSLRAESPILTTVATQEVDYLPRYHGRLGVKLLGEELADGTLAPPRFRPLPNSAVFALEPEETAKVLKVDGDIRLGLAVGHDELLVGIPSKSKNVLPRHTAILGTTGGGKSTTVAGLVRQASKAGMAVILLDVEGEYTFLHEPTADPRAASLLADRGMAPAGVPAHAMKLYHLVGRDTTNPAHPNLCPFSLQFARISPYAAMAMMECNEAQSDRYLVAHEIAKNLLRKLGVFPVKDAAPEDAERQEKILLRLDEFERGYPRMELSFMLDVVAACKAKIAKGKFAPFHKFLKTSEGTAELDREIKAADLPTNVASWGKVHSLLWRLHHLKVFDRGRDTYPRYKDMLEPGRVSVVDLSDAGLNVLSNIAVADVLAGIQEEQDRKYRQFEAGKGDAPPRVLVIVEEAHEFLGAERIAESSHLFDQIARMAKRGRKRWLGLTLVTQLPQHLPRQVLAMCNNFVLHKLTDPQTISTLRHTVSGVDDSLWARLPSLAPGQAVVSFGHMTRPVLTSIDPATSKLRMVD